MNHGTKPARPRPWRLLSRCAFPLGAVATCTWSLGCSNDGGSGATPGSNDSSIADTSVEHMGADDASNSDGNADDASNGDGNADDASSSADAREFDARADGTSPGDGALDSSPPLDSSVGDGSGDAWRQDASFSDSPNDAAVDDAHGEPDSDGAADDAVGACDPAGTWTVEYACAQDAGCKAWTYSSNTITVSPGPDAGTWTAAVSPMSLRATPTVHWSSDSCRLGITEISSWVDTMGEVYEDEHFDLALNLHGNQAAGGLSYCQVPVHTSYCFAEYYTATARRTFL